VKTAVIQSFRTHDVPPWIARCLTSVRDWASRSGFAYQYVDDRIVDLCGPEYLAKVGRNFQSITNLARLELIRNALAGGFDRAIWLDADVFVFAPESFRIDITTGYAFCREVWLNIGRLGLLVSRRAVNNAACVFTQGAPELDLLIATIRQRASAGKVKSNYQLGVWLLNELEPTLRIPLIDSVGMFSPAIIKALAVDRPKALRRYAREFGARVSAANLCLALTGPGADRLVCSAMDALERTGGDAINRYVTAPAVSVPPGTWLAGQ